MIALSGTNIVTIFVALGAGIIFVTIALYVPNSILGYSEFLPTTNIELTIVGLNHEYKIGTIVDFHVKYKETEGCDSPKLDVIKLPSNSPGTSTLVQSNRLIISCAASNDGLGLEGDWHVGSNAFPPFDKPIVINETGNYVIQVTMRDKVLTSELFKVVS
jgi:hypothetical protein